MKSFKYLKIAILLLICSCSGLKRINVSMLEPGAISFDPDVNTVVLLNRALPSQTKASKIESIITGEGQFQDKQGRQQVLAGIHSSMLNSPRLKCVLTSLEYPGQGSGSLFPTALGWDTIRKICEENRAEALISLETYDSDCIITHESGQVQVNNQFGIPIPTFQIFVTQKIIVKLGFRIYDLKNRRIIDQYNYSYYRTFNSQANSIGEIMTGILDRQLAINQTAYDAGVYLKRHISPTWCNESRALYTRSGSSPMAIGSRQAMVGNWKEAMENWRQVMASAPKRKLAGRASYNMALACEITGDLNGAREWISKSYGNFSNNKALYYQNTINRRYQEVSKLDQQMK
jgi:hypothetical protein